MISKRLFICVLMGAWLIGFASSCSGKPEVASCDEERCEAMTQKGERCKLKVVDGSSYCPVHYAKDDYVPQCKATTKKGSRCSRPANDDGYCTQHGKMYN